MDSLGLDEGGRKGKRGFHSYFRDITLIVNIAEAGSRASGRTLATIRAYTPLGLKLIFESRSFPRANQIGRATNPIMLYRSINSENFAPREVE